MTVPINSRETKNTIETRLASFASLICRFTFLFSSLGIEVAAGDLFLLLRSPGPESRCLNPIETRLASFASLICRFTFLFSSLGIEVAAGDLFLLLRSPGPESRCLNQIVQLTTCAPAECAFYITLTSGKSIRRAVAQHN